MADDDIPPGILAAHPEVVAIGEALAQARRGDAITARCHKCSELLRVTDIVEVGVTVVSCAGGHVLFRSKTSRPTP